MYASRSALPRSARSVSFGAALALNAGIIAALVFVSPDIIRTVTKDTTIFDVPIDEPPPPVEQPKPKTDTPRVQQETVYVPPVTPVVQSDMPPIQTTNVLPETPPVIVGNTPAPGFDPPKPPPLVLAEIDPRYAKDFQPQYPSVEIRSGNEGTVSVRVRIGTDGRVKDVQKVSATSEAFFDATRRQALSRWRFRPATRGGVAEESWKTMRVRFEVTNG
jgi:protein TonB